MRPLPGDDAFGHQRSADCDGLAPANSSTNNHMSFFLADEATVDSYLEQSSTGGSRSRNTKKVADKGYVVSAGREENMPGPSRSTSRDSLLDYGSAYSPLSTASFPSPTPVPTSSRSRAPLSRPITPITLGTSVTGSLVSSPSSERDSPVGSISEHAVSWDENEHIVEAAGHDMVDSGSAPQLVMPSIKMPSRRPFTETGKSLDRLRIMIAGRSGVGKTSLVKAIVQSCEHIVHVDPIGPHAGARISSKATARPVTSRRRSSDSTHSICEIFASTKPYPEWWTELDDLPAGQKRKSLGDHVLDRNICFVDTPGYGVGSSSMETIVPCTEYVESRLNKVSTNALSDSELLNLLGGDGGFQVDVVLYMIQQDLSPADIEYLRRLAPLTNIIPLLARADLLSLTEQATCKRKIAGQLHEAGLRCFTFMIASSPLSDSTLPCTPYAVSTASGSDHELMDASLLMSPAYVQPLVSSELTVLVKHLFSIDGSSWLRHSAAKKYMQWREATNARPKHLYRPLSAPVMALDSATGALISRPPFTLARLHGYGSNSSAPRLEMVDWATDLQRSLTSERLQYEARTRGERAVWLTGELNDCVRGGMLINLDQAKEADCGRKKKQRGTSSKTTSRHQDPLGLLQVTVDLKAKGWLALEVFSSLGILGGLAYWLARQRWQTETIQSVDDWARMWEFDI